MPMNQKLTKRLKEIIGYQKEDPIQKKHFKRLKKKYLSLSSGARKIFLKDLEKVYNTKDEKGIL